MSCVFTPPCLCSSLLSIASSSLLSLSLSRVVFQAKDVTHIWELGGGTHLAKLLDVPICAETIRYRRLAEKFVVWLSMEVIVD